MEDDRVREFETSLWIGGPDVYRRSIDPECLMVVPAAPFVMSGEEAIEAVSKTPRWDSVEFDDLRIARPQEGLIVLAYGVRASRGGETYRAYCSSTYRRVAHEQWQVVQHQQTLAPVAESQGERPAQAARESDAGGGQDRSGESEMGQAQKQAAEDRGHERGYQ